MEIYLRMMVIKSKFCFIVRNVRRINFGRMIGGMIFLFKRRF